MLKNIAKTLAIGLCAAALMIALPFQVTAKPKNLSKNVKVGDIVYFGRYEQDGNSKNGKEKIEWQVLDKKGGKALLISKKILDVQPYNKKLVDITWEKCTLRTWLNKDFMKAAFTSKESKKVQNSKIENKDNKEYGTKGGKNTTDKIFLLSINEAEKYYKTFGIRTAELTNYGIKRVAKIEKRSEKDLKAKYFSENKNWWYWLRSPGYYQNYAADVDIDGWVRGGYGAIVYDDGFVEGAGNRVFIDSEGVRPAIWVNP